MKIRFSRPSVDRIGFDRVISRAQPIMKGARPIASKGKPVTPSRTTNSRIPAKQAGDRRGHDREGREGARVGHRGGQSDKDGDEREGGFGCRPAGHYEEGRCQGKVDCGPDAVLRGNAMRTIQGRAPLAGRVCLLPSERRDCSARPGFFGATLLSARRGISSSDRMSRRQGRLKAIPGEGAGMAPEISVEFGDDLLARGRGGGDGQGFQRPGRKQFGDKVYHRRAGGRASRLSAVRFCGEARDLGTQGGDFAQQSAAVIAGMIWPRTAPSA